MAKKKHLSGIDEADLELIDSKMRYDSSVDDMETNQRFSNQIFSVNIKCRNKKQKDFLNVLKDDNNQICIGLGAAGSGKSYISLAYALSTVRCSSTSKYKHIVCLIPTCPAGNMNIGFLKGTLEEKIEPYLEADTHTMTKILENSGNYSARATIDSLIRNGIIRYELVNFARGKTFDNSLILINEAENYSKEEMLLILTRLGENSKIIITGDLEQLDRQDIKKTKALCGLEYAVQRLGDMDEVAAVEFTVDDIVRNPLITQIITRWKS